HGAGEHRANQRREPAHHHARQRDRDEQIGKDDPEYAEAYVDDEHQPQHDREDRSRQGQNAERDGAAFEPEHVKREKREAYEERVQQDESKRERMRGTAQEDARDRRRRCQQHAHHRAVEREQKEEDGAGEPLPRRFVIDFVEEPHERSVETETEDDLRHDLDAAEQTEHAVIRGGQIFDEDAEQEKVDDRHGHVAEAVDRHVLRELANFQQQGGGSPLPEGEQVQEAPAR